jgi:glycosyltransferase involved in cell wall biosynthesis
MTPKKILIFCGGSYVFGKEVVTLNLITELHSRGVIVHCIVNGWNNGDFVDRLKAVGVTYDEIKLGFIYLNKPLWTLDSLVHYPGAMLKLSSILHSFQPDFVYFNSERVMFSTYPLIKNHKIILHLNEPIQSSGLNKLIVSTFKKTDLTYVVCSNFIKKKLQTLLGDKKKINVIYNAIEVIERTPHHASLERINIGVVGQIRYHKGQDILFKALSQLKHYNYSCYVYGSGDNDYKKELYNIAVTSGIAEKVLFKGFEKNIERIYSDLDIVVVPSRFEEPFGLVAIEPAQWKLPVIVSNRGGLPEVVEDGVTGLVFENEDVEGLISKLRLLMEDKNIRNKLGANAFVRAKHLFDKKEMGSAFLKLIG